MKEFPSSLFFVLISTSTTFCFAQMWVARYDGPNSAYDRANAIAVDSASNVYVTGVSYGPGYHDYATVKYDSDGIEQWVARYDCANDSDHAHAIAVDGKGNVYVTGMGSDSWNTGGYATVKYNSAGIEQWVAHYYGSGIGYDCAYAIALDHTGNIYVTGSSYESGSYDDYTTVKYDSSGAEQWVAHYDGPESGYDNAWAIALDHVGGVYVTGSSIGTATGFDHLTVKYDSLGVEQWVARYNGYRATAIALDDTGNVYVTGWTSCSAANTDYATVKYDSSGIEQWVALYGAPDSLNDLAWGIALGHSGDVYVTGYANVGWMDGWHLIDYATIKYGGNGEMRWLAFYDGGGEHPYYDIAHAITVDAEGNAYVTGRSTGSGTGYDYATVKYEQ